MRLRPSCAPVEPLSTALLESLLSPRKAELIGAPTAHYYSRSHLGFWPIHSNKAHFGCPFDLQNQSILPRQDLLRADG